MESTLHSLGSLLIQAIPTILCFIFLTFFLNSTLFRPLGRILDARREATEGVRSLAQQAIEAADQKTSEFERALHLAQAEIYKEHEQLRRRWEEERTGQIEQARTQAGALVEQAKRQIEGDAINAQAELTTQVQSLSDRIIDRLLRRRAA